MKDNEDLKIEYDWRDGYNVVNFADAKYTPLTFKSLYEKGLKIYVDLTQTDFEISMEYRGYKVNNGVDFRKWNWDWNYRITRVSKREFLFVVDVEWEEFDYETQETYEEYEIIERVYLKRQVLDKLLKRKKASK